MDSVPNNLASSLRLELGQGVADPIAVVQGLRSETPAGAILVRFPLPAGQAFDQFRLTIPGENWLIAVLALELYPAGHAHFPVWRAARETNFRPLTGAGIEMLFTTSSGLIGVSREKEASLQVTLDSPHTGGGEIRFTLKLFEELTGPAALLWRNLIRELHDEARSSSFFRNAESREMLELMRFQQKQYQDCIESNVWKMHYGIRLLNTLAYRVARRGRSLVGKMVRKLGLIP